MNASTRQELALCEEALGVPARLAAITGFRAYERFTAAQILKRRKDDPTRFARTDRMLLINSFMASLLAVVLATVDVGDASGINRADLTVEHVRW
jgi:xylulokinase